MVAISQPWYNGSYTIAAKPIKTLESHYTMIQFLININISAIYIIFSYSCNFVLKAYGKKTETETAESRNQIILPREDHVTSLIIDHYHGMRSLWQGARPSPKSSGILDN